MKVEKRRNGFLFHIYSALATFFSYILICSYEHLHVYVEQPPPFPLTLTKTDFTFRTVYGLLRVVSLISIQALYTVDIEMCNIRRVRPLYVNN